MSSSETAIIVICVLIIVAVCGGVIAYTAVKSKKAKRMKYGYRQISIGMSMEQVIEILGEPDVRGMKDANTVQLKWKNNEWVLRSAFNTNAHRTIIVDFVDGKVSGFTADNINDRTL